MSLFSVLLYANIDLFRLLWGTFRSSIPILLEYPYILKSYIVEVPLDQQFLSALKDDVFFRQFDQN